MTNDNFDTLPAPAKPSSIPKNSAWLSGEGAGSWFSISEAIQKEDTNNLFQIVRYSPEGTIECDNLFKSTARFNCDETFVLNYLSHCAEVNLTQRNKKIKFTVQLNNV